MSGDLINPQAETASPWQRLRQFTPARIALGRAGGSVPTAALLDFRLAHARARDAQTRPLNEVHVVGELENASGAPVIRLQSRARDMDEYLRRPDLGRLLVPESRELLEKANVPPVAFDLVIIVSEGLSTLAVETHAPAVAAELLALLKPEPWRIAPICFARRARVALQDEIGECLGATLALILIGERPGLISPDSLGAYLVRHPRRGNTDAHRNCVSNISARGLTPHEAAAKLHWLLAEARRRGLSGVELKDEFDPVRALRP